MAGVLRNMGVQLYPRFFKKKSQVKLLPFVGDPDGDFAEELAGVRASAEDEDHLRMGFEGLRGMFDI